MPLQVRHHAAPVPGRANELIVLTWANTRHQDELFNWMLALHKLGVHQYAVICMDNELAALMARVGRPCFVDHSIYNATGALGFKVDWLVRLKTAKLVLEAGVDCVMSDIDAVWLKKPFDLLIPYDITSSRAGGFWHKEAKVVSHGKWGAAACLGFTYLKCTPAVVQFLQEEVIGHFMRDDQTSMNEAFLRHNLTFPTYPTYQKSTTVVHSKITTTFGIIKIGWLDHLRFPRLCNNTLVKSKKNSIFVAHCHYQKTGLADSKQPILSQLGAWILPDDWKERLSPNMNFFEWFDLLALTSDRNGKHAQKHPGSAQPSLNHKTQVRRRVVPR